MIKVLPIILLIFFISISNAEVWFDGIYLNSTISIDLSNNKKDLYWLGEKGLIEAYDNLRKYEINNRLCNKYEELNGVFLYKNEVVNNKYEIWIKQKLKQNFADIRSPNTGLVIVIKHPKTINLYPIIQYEDGKEIFKFTYIPPFFQNLSDAIDSKIVGKNPVIINAYSVEKGNIILNIKDENIILSILKYCNFFKLKRVLFIIEN